MADKYDYLIEKRYAEFKNVLKHCGCFLLSVDVDDIEYHIISKRCNPTRGDILISCSGSVGRCSVILDEHKYVMVRSAAMVSPIICNSRFLMYVIQSAVVQEQISVKTKQAVQANLFQGAIKELLLPVPPLLEQQRIVDKIEQCLSIFI